jgi:phosphate starvation-inducible PhoH-like protein
MSEFANEREKNIKFQISLNEEQKQAKSVILQNSITYIAGKAGSGKTLVSCQVALDLFFKKQVKQIIITRPAVEAGEKLGFLPGGLEDKLDPYVQAIYQNFYALYKKERIDKMIQEGYIQIKPFAYMRGSTFCESVIIVDEVQNTTETQVKMVMERLGKGSKMMLCGDVNQIDLAKNITSGIKFLDYLQQKELKNFSKIVLKTNHRDPIVEEILNLYEDFKNKNN